MMVISLLSINFKSVSFLKSLIFYSYKINTNNLFQFFQMSFKKPPTFAALAAAHWRRRTFWRWAASGSPSWERCFRPRVCAASAAPPPAPPA